MQRDPLPYQNKNGAILLLAVNCSAATWSELSILWKFKLTIGLVYRSPNINEDDHTKIQNAINEVSKGECIIMGDFNHGHIQWKISREYRGEEKQFIFLIQESFLKQHVLASTREEMY